MPVEITPALVPILIAKLFSESDQPAATALLAEHAAHANHPEVSRVQVATLKLSDGSIDKLREAIRSANFDYRDVLAWAEYPAQMQGPVTGLSKEQTTSLVSADHLQYDAWLRKHTDSET
jgi:hypothetical protein